MAAAEKLLELRVPATSDQLYRLRCAVRESATEQACPTDTVDCVVLAINEACMNIIQHAYGTSSRGDIILQIYRDGLELVFHLTDFAQPVDKCAIKSRDIDDVRPGGLGVHLINTVMDSVQFLDPPSGVGNVLELRKRIDSRLKCPKEGQQ